MTDCVVLVLAPQVKTVDGTGDDDDDWNRGWSSSVAKEPTSCPACGGLLKAIGLTPEERARIRDTLFGLAGLQVKKHTRSRQDVHIRGIFFLVCFVFCGYKVKRNVWWWCLY